MNYYRCQRLINNAIKTFQLDLSGLTVLTEAASGYYVLTPLIAALAGAKKVYALTKDSNYGQANLICKNTINLAEKWNIADKIEILFSREDEKIGLADIVTNLGFVRPLDAPFLNKLKSTVVIPLMFETWEYRSEDLDLEECYRLNIPVLGTNEKHPDLQIFKYVGHLALKLLFELDIEVFSSQIIVVGGGEFGLATVNSLQSAGAKVTQIEIEKDQSLADEKIHQIISEYDAIVIIEHQNKDLIIGENGQITVQKFKQLNPGIVLVHIAGNVNQFELELNDISFRPSHIRQAGYMSVATDYLGAKPLIDLHTAGLKVGEVMAHHSQTGKTGKLVEVATLQNTQLAQSF